MPEDKGVRVGSATGECVATTLCLGVNCGMEAIRVRRALLQFCGVKMRKKYGREIVNYDKIKILMLNLQSREFLLRNLLLQLQKKCLKILRNF